jgi:hypothetical protein
MRQLLLQRWMPPDLALLKVAKIDPDAIATIIRVINGNFRLLHLLLTQIERILEINSRIVLTKGVVEAARETLVIGQGPRVQIIKWKELRKTAGRNIRSRRSPER